LRHVLKPDAFWGDKLQVRNKLWWSTDPGNCYKHHISAFVNPALSEVLFRISDPNLKSWGKPASARWETRGWELPGSWCWPLTAIRSALLTWPPSWLRS